MKKCLKSIKKLKKANILLNFNKISKKFFSKNKIKKQFLNQLLAFSKGPKKAQWEQNIVKTSLPCIAVSAPKVNQIVKQLSQKNFIDFINLWIWENHTCTLVIGNLITKIDDFETQKQYLIKYAQLADNWATIDCLKFKFNKQNINQFLEFSKQLISHSHTFARRLGVVILLKLCKFPNLIDEIFQTIPLLYAETEYYVNMAVAWLVCECYIKYKSKTLQLFKTRQLNDFVNNKAISKCKDSFRVTSQDKAYLSKYKIN